MPFDSVARLAERLADEVRKTGLAVDQIVIKTGMDERLLAWLLEGEWEELGIKDLVCLAEDLDIDLPALISEASSKA